MTTETPFRTLSQLVAQALVPLAPKRLESPDKEEWAASGFVFTLLSIREEMGEKQPYWNHLIEMDGQQYDFNLQSDGARDGTALALVQLLKDGPVAGVRLHALSKNQGNSFLVLWPAD